MLNEFTRADKELSGSPITNGISRRTVTRGMAWTAPVVLTSVTVPAFAASPAPCVQRAGTLVTSDMDQGYPVVTSVVFGSGTSLITGTVAYATTRVVETTKDGVTTKADESPGYGTTDPDADNPDVITVPDLYPGDTGRKGTTQFTTTWSPNGFVNYDYIKLRHPGIIDNTDTYDATDPGDAIVLTITFSKAVKNLSLSLTDIDADQTQWIDHVTVLPAGFTYTYEDSDSVPTLTGAGTASDPFKTVKVEESIYHEADKGDVHLTWPGSVTTVTIVYRAVDLINESDIGQHIGVGKFVLGC